MAPHRVVSYKGGSFPSGFNWIWCFSTGSILVEALWNAAGVVPVKCTCSCACEMHLQLCLWNALAVVPVKYTCSCACEIHLQLCLWNTLAVVPVKYTCSSVVPVKYACSCACEIHLQLCLFQSFGPETKPIITLNLPKGESMIVQCCEWNVKSLLKELIFTKHVSVIGIKNSNNQLKSNAPLTLC